MPDAPAWIQQLPGDLQSNESLTGFATIGDLATSYLSFKGTDVEGLQTKVGELEKTNETLASEKTALEGRLGEAIIPLGENPTDEERSAFRTKINKIMGVPEKADDYELKPGDVKLPEGIEYDAAIKPMEGWWKETAHKLGLSPEQSQGVFEAYLGKLSEGTGVLQDSQKKQMENTQKATEAYRKQSAEWLEKTWGKEHLKANADIAMRAFYAFSDNATIKYLQDSGLADNPIIVNLFYQIGTKILDDAILRDVVLPENEDNKQIQGVGGPRLRYKSDQ